MAANADLVDQIKASQRSDPGFKQAWWSYCDQHLGGSKDPSRHDASVLEEFLSSYSAGEYVAPQAPPPRYQAPPPRARAAAVRAPIRPAVAAVQSWGAPPVSQVSLADVVKAGQRKSPSWKTAWQAYCSLYGNSVNDPFRHDEEFVRGFIDYVGELAEASLAQIAEEDGLLVTEPAPVVGSKRTSPFGSLPPAKRQATPAGADPDKKAMVDKIKALQRSNPDAKQAWWAYCDAEAKGVKDPSRHEIESLEMFMVSYE